MFRCDAQQLRMTLHMELPLGLGRLLQQILSGWDVVQVTGDTTTPDIRVSGTDKFKLTSPYYSSGKPYTDIVSILNEVLVALAYGCQYDKPDLCLIHAAGFRENKSNTVVFGTRKAGKSVLTARMAAEGYRIYADDLLLWHAKRREFITLGIAPRLRRPVLPDLVEKLGAETLIAGAYTCYLIANKIDLAPAGEVLRPDQLVLLGPDQVMKPIPLLRIADEIAAHRIT